MSRELKLGPKPQMLLLFFLLVEREESSGVCFSCRMTPPTALFFPLPIQLAEVKVRILEAKQALEECITAQEFSRAAELKDTIIDLENNRNQMLQEITESHSQDIRSEKVHNHAGSTALLHLH